MKTLLSGLACAFVLASQSIAFAEEDATGSAAEPEIATFTETFSFTGPQVEHAEREKHLCFRIARKGKFVKFETVDAPWHESGGTYTYRYTEFKSGMQCKELVDGRNTRQFGNVKKESCWCSGKLEIVK